MKQITLTLIAILILLFSGCKKVEKDVYNYYPKVTTISAELLADGSVKLKGKLLSQGHADLMGVGFCMDTLPHPLMHYNQIISDTLFDDNFYSIYTYLEGNKKYYFRSWAVNGNGYSYGEEVSIENIHIDTSFLPCKPAQNTINITGLTPQEEAIYGATALGASSSDWSFIAYSNSHTLHITFGKKPTTGKYKIVESASYGNYVEILYTGSLSFGSNVLSGDVYVNQLSGNEIEVTVCNALIQEVSGNYIMMANVRSPL